MTASMGYQDRSDPMLQQILLTNSQVGPSPERARTEGGIRPLGASEIVSAVERELVDALGSYGSSIHEQRRINLRRYHGKPFGNEVEGSSQAQVMSVADTVDWLMPSMMTAIFGAGRTIWDFLPPRPDQEFYAAQASDAVNHVFLHQLSGFEVIYDIVKTALLEKRGYAAVYWAERSEPKRHTYRGLTQEMVGFIASDPNVELVEFGPHRGELMTDPMTGVPSEVFDITVVRTTPKGRVEIESIAPENMLLARRETKLNDETHFSGYRKRMMVGDLIALGYDPDLVALLPADNRPEFAEGRVDRLYDEDAWPLNHHRGDGASRELWVNYIYIRLDEDGDGYAELREIVCVGDSSITILSDKIVNRNPLISITPIPMPHKFHGICPADQAVDDQMIQSQILRQLLDNQVRMNNSRYAVVGDAVNLDDLVANLPGGAVRVDAPGMIEPLITQPLSQGSFELLNYMTSRGEKRTGVSSWQQGPDAADMKYQTSGAVSNVSTAAETKTNLINLVFAHTGIKDLGKKILQTMCENYAGPFIYRLRGQWVECDPRNWDQEMECVCEPGKGVGAMEAHTQQLMMIAQAQQTLLAGGMNNLVTPRQVYATARDLVKNFGIGHEGRYFTDPGDAQWPQPQPALADQVKVMESQRRTQEDMAAAQHNVMSLAVQASGQEGIASFRREELAAKSRLDIMGMRNQKDIAELQIEGQIRAAVANRNQQQGAAA